MNQSPINIKGATNGTRSSEHAVTWKTMLASLVVIACQVVGQFWLGIDLGINIDLALSLGFGSGMAYTVSRMGLKAAIAYAQGKVSAAEVDKVVPKPSVDRARLPAPTPAPVSAKAESIAREPNIGAKLIATPSPFAAAPSVDTRAVY